MNINNVKRASQRIDTSYLSSLGIQSYGKDNLYPQRMYDLIRSSVNGGTCCERYETFIEGNGMYDTAFSEYVCNRAGQTIDDIFHLIAQDIALFHGFALHISYNLLCQVAAIHHIPFMQCRLEEETDEGRVEHIAVHPDWAGRKTRKGKNIKVSKDTVTYYRTFNPRKDIVLSQIIEDGGIKNYTGQVLWYSMDGRWDYPVPIYDKVVTNLSTDEGLDNVKYRNVRNNFLVAGMLVHKKGSSLGIDDNGNPIEREDNGDITESLNIFQGDENACAIMDVTVEQDDDRPEFVNFEAQNFDRKFESTEKSVISNIYAAFGQEPWYRMRTGSLGFSSDILTDTYEYYNSYVAKERRAISRCLKSVFDHWHEQANQSGNYEVQPLLYIKSK